MNPTIAVAGMATIDYLYVVASHPGLDSENRVETHLAVVGGPAGRGAIASVRLGGSTRLLATCGVGTHAEALRSGLSEEGVDFTLIETQCTSQHSAVIVARDSASRTTLWLPHPKADERVLARVDEFIRGADAVLVDANDAQLTDAVLRACIAQGIPSVIDTGSRKPWTQELLPMASFVVAPQKYFAVDPSATPDEVASIPSGWRTQAVVSTRGNLGGLWGDQSGVHHYRAAPVNAVDTCGAGDTFHGAFTWAIGAGYDTKRAVEFGAFSAALKTAQLGNATIPTLDEIRDAQMRVGSLTIS